jgi:hypothetical protein
VKKQALPLPGDSPYRDEAEAALYLRLSPRTLEEMRRKSTGPRYRRHGGRVVYAVDDLRAWSDARARLSTSDVPEERGATAPTS